ncbi:MAG: PAS domain-containing sensor histidine kinase [Sulfuricurvum sp.]|nr:PAS domain-containing sensor histidine kinase [Sulfuricurvum sp.]MDP3023338.1 PAS domain-containing sensor histidine kinase [Sulfuricurvum sp.]MDP3119444.1 PAS domain-containing sensor histidine kinase [Sulfuricurvum sp.]
MHTNNLPQLFDLLDTLPNPATLNALAYDDNGIAYDKIVYVNKSFIKTIGYTVEDIPDDNTWFATAYPDTDYQHYISSEWHKAVEKAKAEQTDLIGFPAKVHCKDGEDRWFSITTQLTHTIDDQYRTIIFVQTQSPSEIKLQLDKKSLDLLQEKWLLKTIIDTAPVRIFWKDEEGVYLGCNEAFLHDAGLTDESQIVGKNDFDMIWKKDAKRFREDDRRVRESGIPELSFLERQPHDDGKDLILSTSKVPLIDAAGKTIGILGLYHDITKEFESKEALKEKDKLLLAQSRQAAMGEMLSMIAHQWRQPLSSITAVVTTIQVQQTLGNSTMEGLTKQLEAITHQIEYLSRTITDFSNFYKKDKNKQQVQPREVVDHALRLITKLLENNNIQLRDSCLSTKTFYAFPNELQHVFINLIKNAADVLIESNKEEKWISILCQDDTEFITFEISDNGGGIDKSLIDRIFEPYFSTKHEKNGTGLGLYMSKTIIEKNLGGTLSCKNSSVGAVFTIRLPIVN